MKERLNAELEKTGLVTDLDTNYALGQPELHVVPDRKKAIERGVAYYVGNLFDQQSLPKPFSRRPRLTVYRRELYDCAECINLAVMLRGRFPALDDILSIVLNLNGWQKADGSFRSRQLFLGWDNCPMHRWAQSQLFRSLCFLLYQDSHNGESESVREN